MNAIIVGCGKLGSGLALNLIQKGYSVTVIDENPETFELLGKDFAGQTIVGIGFDKGILEKAQIRSADALIACCKSDVTNALIGRISRNIFRVPHVISRIYDPRKAEIYHTLGIQTISATTWGIKRVTEMLSYSQLDSVTTIGDDNVEIVRIDTPALMINRTVSELSAIGEIHVVAISRNNKTFLPSLGTPFQKDDVIYIAVISSSVKRLKSILGLS